MDTAAAPPDRTAYNKGGTILTITIFLFKHLGYAIVVDGCYKQGYVLIG